MLFLDNTLILYKKQQNLLQCCVRSRLLLCLKSYNTNVTEIQLHVFILLLCYNKHQMGGIHYAIQCLFSILDFFLVLAKEFFILI